MARSRARTAATVVGLATTTATGLLAGPGSRRRRADRGNGSGASPVSTTRRSARGAATAGVGAEAGDAT